MAIVQNFWLKGASKRLAGAVIYEAMGQTRARQLASSVTNPRTEAQMSQRIRWANAVSFYRANASWMKYAFETKKANQSEYNKFMSINVTTSPIALTKSAAAAGACVVAPYIITQGSLPSIEWQNTTTQVKSNIFLPSAYTITEQTTVGNFAEALLTSNPAMREGDQLSLIRFTQMTNASTGYPYIIVRKYEVLLKSDSQALLNDYIPTDYIQVPGSGQDNAIYVSKENRHGGFAMILSRTIAGKTYVSTQSVEIVNNEDLIAQYSSQAAIAAAITSYGDSTDAFLSSTSAVGAQTQPVGLSLNSITYNNTTYVSGSKTPYGGDLRSGNITANLSGNIPEGAEVVAKTTFTGSAQVFTVDNPTVQGNTVIFNGASNIGTDLYEAHLYTVTITIDGVDYTLTFASSSDYTQEGMD